MPLMIAPLGIDLSIKRITGEEKVRRHLETLGIVPGRPIQVLSYTRDGLILLVNQSRLALDKDVARNIYVEA